MAIRISKRPRARTSTSRPSGISREDSAIYGTYFTRDIEGLVVPYVQTLNIPGTGLNVDTFKVTRPVNASDGEIDGFELGVPVLPGRSARHLQRPRCAGQLHEARFQPEHSALRPAGNIIGEDTSAFFGVSDTSYNVTLAYDHSGLGGRLSYVWREDFLNNNEARLFANPIGIWRQPESQPGLPAELRLQRKLRRCRSTP